MNLLPCPLSILAQSQPNTPFILGDENWSYLNFEEYVQQIQDKHLNLEPKSVVAVKTVCPFTTFAFFVACLRKNLIFFPLNPKLPDQEIDLRLKESQAKILIQEKIPFTPTFDFKSKSIFYYDPKAACSYLLTSGSSSRPKICVHSIENYFESAYSSNLSLPFIQKDCWLVSLPLFHVGGLSLLFRALLAKASLLISTERLEEALEKYSPTHISLVSTQLMRLLKTPTLLKKLKAILLGGGPISDSLLEKASSLPIYSTYGLTEMTSQVATGKNNHLHPLKYVSLKLDSKNQILVKGPMLFLGYLENSKVKPCLNSEGWFETKDLGLFSNNQLQIIGRSDNQFISGGENILPEEIETALLKHPHILEAIVVPSEDSEFGQIPIAFVKSDHQLQEQEYISFLEKTLPRYKIPKTYLSLSYEGLKPSRKKCKESLDKLLFR